jgi:hypothetical protein
MRTGNGLRLRASVALKLGPEPAEGERRSVIIKRVGGPAFALFIVR